MNAIRTVCLVAKMARDPKAEGSIRDRDTASCYRRCKVDRIEARASKVASDLIYAISASTGDNLVKVDGRPQPRCC
jgi:hypothetical protein